MQKKPEHEKVWKVSVSLPPACHAFFKTQRGTRSALIADAVMRTAAYRRWLKEQ